MRRRVTVVVLCVCVCVCVFVCYHTSCYVPRFFYVINERCLGLLCGVFQIFNVWPLLKNALFKSSDMIYGDSMIYGDFLAPDELSIDKRASHSFLEVCV